MLKLAEIKPDKYVVAVSGGVDSMVLLHALASMGLELEVAYVDHGWRDTNAERRLVESAAKQYSLTFHLLELSLKGKSEVEARAARYEALESLRLQVGAKAIITGHNYDDRVETLLMKVMRGTGRRGMVPLRSEGGIIRPLLKTQRHEIEDFARASGVEWIEDPTNQDLKYQRNLIRHRILPALRNQDPGFDEWVERVIGRLEKGDVKITRELERLWKTHGYLNNGQASLPLAKLRKMDINVLQEVLVEMAHRVQPHVELDSAAVEQLAIDAKTGRLRTPRPLSKRLFAQVSHGTLSIAFIAS